MSKPDLTLVQQWFQTVMVGKGHLPEKLMRAESMWEVETEDLIIGNEDFNVPSRIGVYTTGYMLRLLECMQADLPSLYAFWGPELFDTFGRAYLLQHPSQSPSLYDLTSGFADFLDRTRPPKEKIDPEDQVQYDVPAELVRMERARLAAILSKGTEDSPAQTDTGFFSFFAGALQSVNIHPAVQLLTQPISLIPLYRELMTATEHSKLEYKTTYVAVTRVQFAVHFHEVINWQYFFLEHLQQNGSDHQTALHHASEQTGINKADLLSDFFLWIPNAIRMGLVIESFPADER